MSEIFETLSPIKQGIALAKEKKFDEAIKVFKKLHVQDRRDVDVLHNLAMCYIQVDDFDTAIEFFHKAIKLDPRRVESLYALGSAYLNMHKPKDAVEYFQRAYVYGFQKELMLYREWAKAYRILGDFTMAEDVLLKGYRVDRNSEIILALAVLKKYKTDEHRLLPEIERQMAAKRLPYFVVVRLLFAKAKICRDLKKYDEAFESYIKANNLLMPKIVEEDLSEVVQIVDFTRHVFTPSYIQKMSAHGLPDAKPIFIVGTPRSGTTLTERIIASHSLVTAGGEQSFMEKAFNSVGDFHLLSRRKIRQMASMYIKSMRSLYPNPSPFITDKMPSNSFLVGLIKIMFPNAVVIHCRRHPLDACVSMYFQHFKNMRTYYSDFRAMAIYYKKYAQIMKIWDERFEPGTIYHNYYEKMVNEPEIYSRKLIDACGLEWQEQCLDYHKQKGSVHTASVWQVRQPVYKGSLFSHKKYEKFLTPLQVWLEEEIAEYEALLQLPQMPIGLSSDNA